MLYETFKRIHIEQFLGGAEKSGSAPGGSGVR